MNNKKIVDYAVEEEKLFKFFSDNFHDKTSINWKEQPLPDIFDLTDVELTFINNDIWMYRHKLNSENIYYLFGIKKSDDYYLRLILNVSSNSKKSMLKFFKNGKILIQFKIHNQNPDIFYFIKDNFDLKVHKKHRDVYYIVLGDSLSLNIFNTIIKFINCVVFNLKNNHNFLYVTDLVKNQGIILQTDKNIVLNKFNNELNDYDYINDLDKSNLKTRYYKDYYNFYYLLGFDDLILKHNDYFIENEKTRILNSYKGKYIAHRDRKKIKDSINFKWNLDVAVKKHNEDYINEQLKIDNNFFDDIEGYSLDDNQRVAVLTDEDNTQIVAGAGTGKTLTIQAKVKYLIEKQGVDPEDILCISFSNSARDDLADKLKKNYW